LDIPAGLLAVVQGIKGMKTTFSWRDKM